VQFLSVGYGTGLSTREELIQKITCNINLRNNQANNGIEE
jgi:hypothetical protein